MDSASRRRVLQAAGVGLGSLIAGCQSQSDDERPPATQSPPATSTDSPTAKDPGYPDVDERVDEPPPGSPALDPDGSWPSFRFDAANTGANPDGVGLRDGTTDWRLDAGGSATVADGTLYNVGDRDRSVARLTIRDPATAAVETGTDLVSYAVNPPPVVADGRVFVTTFVEVFCFDAATGEQLWRGPEMDGIQGRPTVSDGTVFVNSGGFKTTAPQLRAFDAATGDEYWHYDPGADTKATPAVGEEHVFLTGSGGLAALDRETGEESFVLPAVSSRWGSPVVRDGVVYAVDTGHDRDEVVAVDVASGTIRWRHETGTDSPPVVAERGVYTTTDSGIVGLDREDGTVRSSGRRAVRPLALVGDVLYAAGDGTVYAYDVADDLASLWSVRTEDVQISDTSGRAVYHVTPVDGAVYVSARDAFYGIGPTDTR